MNIFKPHQIFDQLKRHLAEDPIILEAGSCDGKDALHLHNAFPKATIHAFEPVPYLHEKLVANTKDIPSIHTYNIGLSNTSGTAQFHIAEKTKNPGVPTQAGSLHAPKKRLEWSPIVYPRTIDVQLTTIDSWAHQHKIDHIDCMWLDMQGHELYALQGAQKMLPTVRALYVEMNFIEAYEGQPLFADVDQWIKDHGFAEVGRTFANQTDWFFGNVLYVKK